MPPSQYVSPRYSIESPRLPLEGRIDLTYRCNNRCRHCWLWVANTPAEAGRELTFDQIIGIIDEARSCGCRKWAISGGEPMLRPDFAEIFRYATDKCTSYSLNTNGALITPSIALLLKRKGIKMVALYGATAEVHDHVTRTPGSFEATMRGFSYLREAGAGFEVQIIPMRDNFHQLEAMMALADTLGGVKRIGAAWLYLSAQGVAGMNRDILAQRLTPRQVVELDPPNVTYREMSENTAKATCGSASPDDNLFASCISARRDFHVDPYGGMTFCSFIKEPSMRYDLRSGTFREGWDNFIPSLATKIRGGKEYSDNCGTCASKKACRWCPVYGFLEHRRFEKRVEYLCQIASEAEGYTAEWLNNHRRYYEVAGITLQIDSDLPIQKNTFDGAIRHFQVPAPGTDLVRIRHHFTLPALKIEDLGQEVYRRSPWAIYKKEGAWTYLIGTSLEKLSEVKQIVKINREQSILKIFNRDAQAYHMGNHNSLCLFPTDQILIARLVAQRQAFLLHSAGLAWNAQGFVFVGHSEAGKSTTCNLLRDRAEILCDDRMILRKWGTVWKIHGTWSHGDVPDVSPVSAPLHSVLFLEKADENRLIRMEDPREINHRLLACVIKSFADAEWWRNTLPLVEEVSKKIPCYRMLSNNNGDIVKLLEGLMPR